MTDRYDSSGQIHDAKRLKELQALPLEQKIGISTARIIEFYEHFNGNVYVSMSGGKDSTVLYDMVHKLFPDVPAVFSNTGLEYPEIQRFAKEKGCEIVTPTMNFHKVISTYGYPIISKEVSEAIYYARRIIPASTERERVQGGIKKRDTSDLNLQETAQQKDGQQTSNFIMGGKTTVRKRKELHDKRKDCYYSASTHELPQTKSTRNLLLPPPHKDNENQNKTETAGSFVKSQFNKEKWLPIARDAPFLVSHYCCNVMKKSPLAKYQRATKRYPYIGTMAVESRQRKQAWIRHGCNAFDSKKKTSQPMSFWTEQDVLNYIKIFDIDICSVYGDIVPVDESVMLDGFENDEPVLLKTTGVSRSGCVYCAFGCHLEKEGEERFLRLKETHPKQYDFCINGGEWGDNPYYDPIASTEPDEIGWVNWNPKKIWLPDKHGLGMGFVFDWLNSVYGENFIRYK